MKVKTDLVIRIEDIFGHDPIKVSATNKTVSVNLYDCLKESLLNDIEIYGVYETFPDEIDTVIKDEDNDDLVDEFLAYAKEQVINNIKHDNLKILDFHINPYGDFDLVLDINFTRMWKQFKEKSE